MDYKLIKNARENQRWKGHYINLVGRIANIIEQYYPLDK